MTRGFNCNEGYGLWRNRCSGLTWVSSDGSLLHSGEGEQDNDGALRIPVIVKKFGSSGELRGFERNDGCRGCWNLGLDLKITTTLHRN